ncbi:hypothetical protein FOS14_09175 [Skermania sp. ID1734]|uniref:hypothetical protein n=1 Tax=Skermania sp. ID1734 TaxID=2597516 RepID=UPI00117D0348|nr:hypothetical protein [Skermania sp. ID1734]TSD99988.1 hypothetical protein FOS14_09175 [Skermania sp. ID1734]
MTERALTIPAQTDRDNLAAFVAAVRRLDDSPVLRLRQRGDGLVGVWATTGFDVLAVRSVNGTVRPSDTTVAADVIVDGLRTQSDVPIDLGYSMDSAWRGALPPDKGFTHIDDVPAKELIELAQRGVELAKEHGGEHGPPTSLLDQDVLTVEGAGERVGVAMRVVFALAAMGFVPDVGSDADAARIDPAELVRVRATSAWLRLDARFGSVAKRRGSGLSLTVG